MKQQTIYHVTVNPQAASTGYDGFFLQCPTRKELAAAIKDATTRLHQQYQEDIESGDDDDRTSDRISDLGIALQVVELGEDLVPPIHGMTELRVEVASIVIGEVTVEAIEAYGRDARNVLEQLVA